MQSDKHIELAMNNLRKQESDSYDFQEAIMRRITDLELQQMQLEGLLAMIIFRLKEKL